MIKLIDILNEAKQAGTLYHFTYSEWLPEILETNRLGTSGKKERFKPRPPKSTLSSTKYGNVSLTRDKDFNKKSTVFGDTDVCLILDGDKLSNIYPIKPYSFKGSHLFGKEYIKNNPEDETGENQMEETIPTINNLSKYLLKVKFFKNKLRNIDSFNKSINILTEKNIPYEIV
jgi:hypothetical protein